MGFVFLTQCVKTRWKLVSKTLDDMLDLCYNESSNKRRTKSENEENIMKPFAATLTSEELRFARKVEAAGLASYSQAVKAIEREDDAKIAAWRKALAAKS